MKKTGKVIITIVVLLVIVSLLAVAVYFLMQKKPEEEKVESLPSVVIQKPIVQNLVESITISGYVEAEAMIPVVPFVSGTIMTYNAKAGDYVKKNTLLATIDDAPFRQQMLQAEAAYSAAKNTFARVESLYEAGATTQQNYDSAKAQHDATKAQYDLAKLQVSYTSVKAPVDGTILIADQAAGSIGTQSQPVAILADLDNQVVRLKVPEKYFDLFTMEKDNLVVTVTRPAEKNMYDDAVTSATIQNIAPYVSPESKNFQVVCKLDEPGERFRPGMYVKVQVAYKVYENVPVLPVQTKKMDGSCYLYDENTKTVKYIMPELTATDNVNFIVPEEYADCYFVTDGQNYIFDGQEVVLYEEVLAQY